MSTIELPYDIAVAPMDVQCRYLVMLDEGMSPKLAEMLALQSPPEAKTSRLYGEGREGYRDFDRLPKPVVERYRKTYKRLMGHDMPRSGFYDARLAEFPGDPRAHVKDADDALRVAKLRKLNLSGELNCVNDHGEEPAKKPGLAPDIVERLVAEKVSKNPALALKPKQELREMVIDKHGSKKKA